MNWIEVNITTKRENIEILTAITLDVDITGIEINDPVEAKAFLEANVNQGNYADYVDDALLNPTTDQVVVKFYLPEADKHKVDTIQSEIEGYQLQDIEKIEITVLEDWDWENAWKAHYKAVEIGENVVINPHWETYTGPREIVFNIEPGHLFGTGMHQSTQGCIVELEKVINDESIVIDLGCGTGILGILAKMMGAKKVVAVDIESTAVDIVAENAALNNIHDIDVKVGNILKEEAFGDSLLITPKYNVVVANIVADVIIGLLPFVKKALEGTFICAGIIIEREQDVLTALKENGFEIENISYKDNWVCIRSRYC